MPRLSRLPGTAALLLVLAACAGVGTRPPVAMPAGVPTALAPGDRARLPDGGELAYLRVRSDSRCPPAVTCIHAGWAEIDLVHFTPADARTPLVVSTRRGSEAVHAGGWRIELVELGRGPSPVAHLRTSPSPR